MSKKCIAETFLHSVKINKLPHGGSGVLASVIKHYDDNTTEPACKVIDQPRRSFWVTKPQYRNHTGKKPVEEFDKLDKFVCADHEMEREIFRALNGYYPRGHVHRDKLFESPYLYGASVDVQTIIKALTNKDRESKKIDMAIPTTGFLDIESSLEEATKDAITVITVTHENRVYTAINQHFFYDEIDGRRVPSSIDKLKKLSHDTLQPLIDGMFSTNKNLKIHRHRIPFEFNYFVGEEIECIKWIFDRIHENKTSYIGVWNIDYDIPSIVKAIMRAGYDPKDIMCPKDIPPHYRHFKYSKDEKPVAHHADKWHWVHCSGYTQYYDAMCLYAKLRTVKGKEVSYALDYILKANSIEGKLKFSDLDDRLDTLSKETWHREMTRKYFSHYIVYNQADVVWIQLMEWINNDALSMGLLSGYSALEKFPRQTKKVQDTLFIDLLDRKLVLGTTAADMTSEIDDEILAIGGAVLDPNRMRGCGLRLIKEHPQIVTLIMGFCNDVDFSSMYPTTLMAGNIGTDTKLNTMIAITGEHVQRYYSTRDAIEAFCGFLVSPRENAMLIGTRMYGLPDFMEMEQRFLASL